MMVCRCCANGPIGALTLTRSTVRPFTDKQVELLTTFADQAVIAIENVRLFEAEQQRSHELSEALERQTATSDVLQVVRSPGELEPYQAMLANATRICGAGFGIMWLSDGGGYEVCCVPRHFGGRAASVGVPAGDVSGPRNSAWSPRSAQAIGPCH